MFWVVPPHWLGHLTVENVEPPMVRAKQPAGQVITRFLDVAGHGSRTALSDSMGSVFCVGQVKSQAGLASKEIHGALRWPEPMTEDTGRS